MKMYCKILLFTSILGLCNVKDTFCAEMEKLTDEIRRKIRAELISDGGPRPFLWAHGDYTKLKLIIRSDKKDYDPGEPVKLMFFLRNDSKSEIHVQESFGIEHSWCYGKLFYSNHDEVPLVLAWQNIRQNRESEEFDRILRGKESSGLHTKLQPGEERQSFGSTLEQLDRYFDLSQPDTYELTCFLATACFGQYYDPPLQSNTLTFRILEDGEKAENAEGGMNPPKGEEVFKQLKPPKSVFYVYEDDDSGHPWMRTSDGRFIAKPRKIIDVSPETYYRQNVFPK